MEVAKFLMSQHRQVATKSSIDLIVAAPCHSYPNSWRNFRSNRQSSGSVGQIDEAALARRIDDLDNYQHVLGLAI